MPTHRGLIIITTRGKDIHATYEGVRPQIGGKEEKKNVRSIARRRKKIERHCKCAKREGERDYIVCCRL